MLGRFLSLWAACLISLCIGPGLAACRAADWPNFRGPNHNGISTEKLQLSQSPPATVEQVWSTTVGVGCSSVAISNGRLYTMGNTGRKEDESTHEDVVYCLNANTREEVWRHVYKCGLNFKGNTPPGPFATPTVDGNAVYTFSRKGDVFRLDAATGKVVWHKDVKKELGIKPPFQGGFAGSPLVSGETVILNAGEAGTALNKATGEVIWKSDGEAAQATPVPFLKGQNQCVVVFSGFGVVAAEAATGSELWRFPWDTKYKTNVADPVISGDRVFISSWYRMGCVLLDVSSEKPEIVWRNKNMQNHYSTCVLWDGYLYGFDVATVKCMDFKTGDVMWSLRGGLGRGSLMMADRKLIILTEKGRLLIGEASPQEFIPILRAEIIEGKCYAAPVLANGRIYAKNDRGRLVCVAIPH